MTDVMAQVITEYIEICNLRKCDRLYDFMMMVVTEYPVVAIAVA